MSRLCWSYEPSPPFMKGKYREQFFSHVKESIIERQERLYGEGSMEGYSVEDLRAYARYCQTASVVPK